MSLLASTRAINRRALIAFIAILATVISVAVITLFVLQRQQLRSEAQEELQTEMKLLGELATDALLRSDYATVEALIVRWVAGHDYILQITATMPNGFILVDEKKGGNPKVPLVAINPVIFNGKTLMTINTIGDFSFAESEYSSIIVHVSIVLFGAIFLLGWLLWWILQRTAIKPLEAQILAREEKESELTQRTHDLETALKELDAFSYSISHDLRAPLRAIDGYGHALIEDYGKKLDNTGLDYIGRIRGAAQRMGTLIDDLLALSRTTRRELASMDIDLSALVHDAVENLSQSEPWRSVDTSIAENVHAYGDPSLMPVVINNLIQNAWKFTSRSSQPLIEFGTYKHDGEIVYFVRDNGAGFDMQYADKLFKPFQRLHTPQEFLGSGIGLATVARIIQRHGGKIWAKGSKGEGATFSFTLASGTSA